MKSILVTGGAGFIGSNFTTYYLEKHQDIHIVNLDKLTYAGDLKNISVIKNNSRHTFIKGDICDGKLVNDLFKEFHFNGIINFAAESHVDNSIEKPDEFIQTNIFGTFNLLNTAYTEWMTAPHSIKEGSQNNRFLHISTDEVYGSLGESGLFKESTPYAPNSPYSASKASSDFLVRSYYHTYGLNVVTTNCSNNYGPNQHDEKLIPMIIRKAIRGESIPIYGDGLNIRDWLYVLDHCSGIVLAYDKGIAGETYNIGGNNEKTNLEIVNHICEYLDDALPLENNRSYKEQITFVKDRPGHDYRYAIDASKIAENLGWKAKETFESGIKKTVNWYLDKYRE